MIGKDVWNRLRGRIFVGVLLAGLAVGVAAAPAKKLHKAEPAAFGPCFTQVFNECTVLLNRNLCYSGVDFLGNDVFILSGTPAELSTFSPPNPNPNGCQWGGLSGPTTNDPNVTAVQVGDGSTAATYIQITAPASYAANGTPFKVFYGARNFVKATGAGNKFFSGCIKVHPDVIKSFFACGSATATFSCGSCN
jgi:hypothetical protein